MRHARILALTATALLAAGTATASAEADRGRPAQPRLQTTYSDFTGNTATINAGQYGGASVACPTGWYPASGGGGSDTSATSNSLTMVRSEPYYNIGDNRGWSVEWFNTGPNVEQVWATVVCSPAYHFLSLGAQETVAPGTAKSWFAACPGVNPATGGAFESYDTGTGQPLRFNSSYPDTGDAPNWWHVTATNETSAPADAGAYAVCGPSGPRTIATQSKVVPQATSDEVDVFCPSGMVAAGGGGLAGDFTYLRASEPSDSRWIVRYGNTSRSPQTVTAYAVCVPA
ncbi:hypothetical protein [Catenulispora subtropica]